MTAISLREYLRDATSDLHQQIDNTARVLRLDTPEGYAMFLAAHAAVVIPLEERLEENGIAEHLPDWLRRIRRHVLLSDLADLNLSFTPVAAPSFAGEAALMGATYVLEGSRPGAREILAGLGNHRATRFLRHGEGLRYWPEFLMMLEGSDETRRAPELAVDAAKSVFAMFAEAIRINTRTQTAAAQ